MPHRTPTPLLSSSMVEMDFLMSPPKRPRRSRAQMTYTEMQNHIQVENKVRKAEEAAAAAEKRASRQQKATKVFFEDKAYSSNGERSNEPSAMQATPTPRRWIDADLPYGIGCFSELPKVHIIPALHESLGSVLRCLYCCQNT